MERRSPVTSCRSSIRMAADPLLLQLLHHSLTEWPALQLAIDQGMGGSNARQKQTWMGQVIYDFLLLNKHVVDEDELYDYIADIMDNEFDTIVDDGSMSILTSRIKHFCKLQVANNEQELNNILEQKRSDAKITNQSAAVAANAPPAPAVEQMCTEDQSEPSGSPRETTNGDDEWTLVTRKTNRRI